MFFILGGLEEALRNQKKKNNSLQVLFGCGDTRAIQILMTAMLDLWRYECLQTKVAWRVLSGDAGYMMELARMGDL